MTNLPASRAEAKLTNAKLYFTGEPCPYGHLAPRFTSIAACKECCRIRAQTSHTHTTTRRRAYSDQKGFIQAAQKKHGHKYAYHNVVYSNAHTKVEIHCSTHGAFWQSPTNHIQGKGCPQCAAQLVGDASRRSLVDFIKQAQGVWGERWDYSYVTYAGAHTKIHIRCRQHGMFSQTPTNHLTGQLACAKCNHMASKGEQDVLQFVSIWGVARSRDRTLIHPKELDIYMPDRKLAIEYCGEFWHSSGSIEEETRVSQRHAEKHKACEQLGVRLITLYESEWLNHNYAIRRLLRNAMGKAKGKLMARKCFLSSVPHADAKRFYDRYHPQGGEGHGDHYGLFWKGKLVACMRFTFGANDRGRSERVWTLSRYATRITVAGGASRLFKAFLRDKQPTEVKSFSDNRFFGGEMYKALGFQLEAESAPDYMVWSPRIGLRPKSHYQRRMLPSRLVEHDVHDVFDPKTDPRSEADITYLMGCRRIYDCGKKRWVWRVDTPSTT